MNDDNSDQPVQPTGKHYYFKVCEGCDGYGEDISMGEFCEECEGTGRILVEENRSSSRRD